MYGGNGEADV